MNVRLLSYSQPTKEFASQGIGNAQELIAYCARVSNPSNQFNTDTSEKEILRGKSFATEVSASKSFRNVMLIQQRILNSYSEKPDCKTPRTDRTA
jgi:type II secretory pathway component PulF